MANQLNLNILRQHSNLSNPMDKDFNYAEEFQKIDLKKLKQELYDLMTDSKKIGGLLIMVIMAHFL